MTSLVVNCCRALRRRRLCAEQVRLFVEEVNSPRVRVLLDPANLIELNDLDEMFQQLAPWIDCLHAKDRKHHTERGVAAGKGDVDYKRFVTLAAKHTPAAPLLLEYVGPKDYLDSLAYLRNAMQAAGMDWNADEAHSAVYDTEQTARLFCKIANAWPKPA